MLKLVMDETLSSYGSSEVRNTSLRLCGRELGPILHRHTHFIIRKEVTKHTLNKSNKVISEEI